MNVFSSDLDIAIRLATAGLTGLAVGIEREWSGHASGPNARFAGVRTFLLLGLVAGMSGAMAAAGWPGLGAAIIVATATLAVVAYAVASIQTQDRDGTTEMAALLVLATGALCGLGYRVLGSGVAVVAALALAEKSRIQQWVGRIGQVELYAALRFAVLALVVLPLLPEGPYGPHDAIRPRELWSMVLLVSGLDFLGYLARRTAGAERGYGIAGLLGGLVSSTAVTLTFGRQSRVRPQDGPGLAVGVLAACTVLLPRVLTITAALSLPVAGHLLWYLLPPALVGGAFLAAAVRRGRERPSPTHPDERSPLHLLTAIQMGVAFQVVLLIVPWIRGLWGPSGVLTSAAVIGLTDMDALTYSMARVGASGDPALAARAIAVGLVSNTVLKLGLVLFLGAPRFRRLAAPGLLALGAAVVVALLVR
ncbi:MAG TPA: MgtC/SapB family protein [Gemmatimonadales bacterium]|nr:MgtC/SapB family protein [Gemmatimonadales bacterium]